MVQEGEATAQKAHALILSGNANFIAKECGKFAIDRYGKARDAIECFCTKADKSFRTTETSMITFNALTFQSTVKVQRIVPIKPTFNDVFDNGRACFRKYIRYLSSDC